ncbi:MAG: butyrate kinase [Terrisporobacter sp.]|uniref:butyrate kinase n=1 Tax=Terrisporobacter sp. TaxID=1965305 RepID=UPI002FC91388
MTYRILAINPGSTSTKFAVYEGENQIVSKTLDHSVEELAKFASIMEQFEMRKNEIENTLKENNIDIKNINAVVGRCGGLPPVKSGAYLINEEMIDRLINRPTLDHASNLGATISYAIANEIGVSSYIYDPVCVDESLEISKVSGFKDLDRVCLTHALNTRAMAIKYAKLHNKNYNDLNLIVAHLGGGISLNVHEKGRMIDFVSDEEGPFSPERAGRLPAKMLVDLCYSGKYTHKEMVKNVRGKGGIVSYLNTVDAREVEKRIADGDEYAKLIYDALVLQVAKSIGELATVVSGNVDAIIITGGIAYSKYISEAVSNRVKFIAPVEILAGENELEALAFGALRVMEGEEKATIYNEVDLVTV